MVLVDSSVIIDFLNRNRYKDEITKLIVDEQIVTTEIIIMEVLQGIKDDNIYEKVKAFMDSIPIISADYDDHILSANIYRSVFRGKHPTVPPPPHTSSSSPPTPLLSKL